MPQILEDTCPITQEEMEKYTIELRDKFCKGLSKDIKILREEEGITVTSSNSLSSSKTEAIDKKDVQDIILKWKYFTSAVYDVNKYKHVDVIKHLIDSAYKYADSINELNKVNKFNAVITLPEFVYIKARDKDHKVLSVRLKIGWE